MKLTKRNFLLGLSAFALLSPWAIRVAKAAVPTVTSISPNKGSTAWSGQITIIGTNFDSSIHPENNQGGSVTFGGVAVTGIQVVSSTMLKVISPSQNIGLGNLTVNVAVTNSSGTGTLTSAFTYLDIGVGQFSRGNPGSWSAYFGPPPGVILYVDAINGLDTNNGAFAHTIAGTGPLQTWSGAIAALNTALGGTSASQAIGEAWVLFREGQAFHVTGAPTGLLCAGVCAAKPIVFSTYDQSLGDIATHWNNPISGLAPATFHPGVNPRPLISFDYAGGGSLIQTSPFVTTDYIAIIGLDVWNPVVDPTNTSPPGGFPAYDSTNTNDFQSWQIVTTTWQLIEGCRNRYGLTFSDAANGITNNGVRVNRCAILGCYGVNGTDQFGYGQMSMGIGNEFNECVFDHNGWNSGIPASYTDAFCANISLALDAPTGTHNGFPVSFNECMLSRDNNNAQFFAGGVFTYNLITENPCAGQYACPGLFYAGASGQGFNTEFAFNVISEPRLDPRGGQGQGGNGGLYLSPNTAIGTPPPGKNMVAGTYVIHHNIFSNSQLNVAAPGAAVHFTTGTSSPGMTAAYANNNNFYNWSNTSPALIGVSPTNSLMLFDNTTDRNNCQLIQTNSNLTASPTGAQAWTHPGRTVEEYDATILGGQAISTIGGTGSLVTVTMAAPHGFLDPNPLVFISGVKGGLGVYNGLFKATRTSATQFTYSASGTGTPSSPGVMGCIDHFVTLAGLNSKYGNVAGLGSGWQYVLTPRAVVDWISQGYAWNFADSKTLPTLDGNGYATIAPSVDTNYIYVDPANGNDNTGAVNDPTHPFHTLAGGQAVITGTISGSILTVVSTVSGFVAKGLQLRGAGVSSQIYITSPAGAGTWNLNGPPPGGNITVAQPFVLTGFAGYNVPSSFTASLSGLTLTVSAIGSGIIFINQYLIGNGLPYGITIASLGTTGSPGAGGAGTYNISPLAGPFTASFATNVMTAPANVGIAVGQYVIAAGVTLGTTVVSNLTSTTWQLSTTPGTIAPALVNMSFIDTLGSRTMSTTGIVGSSIISNFSGLGQLRDGFPDRVMIKKGSYFADYGAISHVYTNGRSPQEPMIYGSWDHAIDDVTPNPYSTWSNITGLTITPNGGSPPTWTVRVTWPSHGMVATNPNTGLPNTYHVAIRGAQPFIATDQTNRYACGFDGQWIVPGANIVDANNFTYIMQADPTTLGSINISAAQIQFARPMFNVPNGFTYGLDLCLGAWGMPIQANTGATGSVPSGDMFALMGLDFYAGTQDPFSANFAGVASFSGSIVPNPAVTNSISCIMTVSSPTGAPLVIGMVVAGNAVDQGTQILGQLTGTPGGAGTYLVTTAAPPQTVSGPMTASLVAHGSIAYDQLTSFYFNMCEDCCFRYVHKSLTVEGNGNFGASGSFLINKNVICDAYAVAVGGIGEVDSVGILMGRTNATLLGNMLDHNGWNGSGLIPGTSNVSRNQNLNFAGVDPSFNAINNLQNYAANAGYAQPINAQGNISANTSSAEVVYPGGTITGNLFFSSPGGVSMQAPTAAGITFSGNVILNGYQVTFIDGGSSSGIAVSTGLGTPNATNGDSASAGPITITNNIIANSIDIPPGANGAATQARTGVSILSSYVGAVVTNNIVYNWCQTNTPSVVSDQNTNATFPTTVTGNYYDPTAMWTAGQLRHYDTTTHPGNQTAAATGPTLPAFPDPARTVKKYTSQVLGGPASEAYFLARARLQSKTNIQPTLQAAAVINYVQVGFGLAAPSNPAWARFMSHL